MLSSSWLAAGPLGLNLGEVLAYVAALAASLLHLFYRIRVTDQAHQLERTLEALSRGDRARRVELRSGPLFRLGRSLDRYAAISQERHEHTEAMQTELEALVTRDRLTGVGNRRHFDQQIELEAARSKRYRVPVSVVLIDIDHFKRINDTYGHSVGDSILVDVTRRISGQLRDTDTIARWGGEEFAVIAPCTPIPGAETLAEKLRHAVESEAFDVVGKVTISVGVAQLLPGERAKHWTTRADRFLYQAKRLGRNRVCASPQVERDSAPFILVWGEQFLTGYPTVDTEHADLFRLANDLVLLQTDANPSVCTAHLDSLLHCLAAHFTSEEALLRDLGCPDDDIRTHAINHRGLLTQLLELRRRFLAGDIALPELGDFIVRRVAVGHLVGADLPLFASLRPSATIETQEPSTPSIRVKLQRALLG